MTTWKEAFNAVRNERHEARERKERRNYMELKEFLRFYEDCRQEQARIDQETLTPSEIGRPQ